MAFDGIVLKSVVDELNNKCKDYRIDKIYQPEKDEIILSLRGYKEALKLFISADANYPRINLIDKSFDNPASPPLFCMMLRKHIGTGKILDITQYGTDRVLDIKVSAYNELGDACVKHLIVEIMGKYSNIILTDDKNIVLDSIKRVDFTISSKRQLLPGLIYEYPPKQDKQSFKSYDEDIIRNVLYGDKDINADKFAQFMFNGISPIVSREIAYRALNEQSVILTHNDIDKKAKLYQTLKKHIEDFNKENYYPNILYDDEGIPKYFSVIELTQYGNIYNKKIFDSPSSMIEAYFSELHFKRKIKIRCHELTKHVQSAIDKVKRKIAIHTDTVSQSLNKEKYKLFGELLSANIYLLKGGEKSIKVLNYYDNTEVEIPLISEKSPAFNISNYYKKYKKAKTAEEMALKQLEIAKNELSFLEDELTFLENATSQNDIDDIKEELFIEGYIKTNPEKKKKKKNKKEIYKVTDEETGYEIYVGKNSRQNDEITFKMSKGNDMWFHVKDYHGSHVLLKYKGEEFPEQAIFKAATLAAEFSSNENAKVTVDYTKIKFVKKPAGAKPGGVIYTNYNTILVSKTRQHKGD